jgi:hypothetical protein
MADKNNDWWETDAGPGDSKAQAHTPDPHSYHKVASDQTSRMRGSTIAGTVIPRAKDGGDSSGFNCHDPGVVIVDPDAPGGGVAVNLANITPEMLSEARNGTDLNSAHRAFRNLSKLTMEKTASSSPTPVVASGGVFAAAPAAYKAPVTPQPLPQPAAPQPAAPAASPSMQDLIAAVTAAVVSASPQPVQLPPAQAQPDILPRPTEPPTAGLNIAFLKEREVQRPACELLVDMGPETGHFSFRFHEIFVDGDLLITVFDNRYTDTGRWIPPSLGAERPLKVACPQLKQSWTVYSMGLRFSLGVLDFSVFMIEPDTNAVEPEQL